MEFRDKHVTLNEGEFIIVPRGVEHRPNAPEEVEVLLFEPAARSIPAMSTMNSTKKELKTI